MNSIVVSNIPPACSRRDLLQHFCSPDHGGGEVAYMLYPLGTDNTRAVIEFVGSSVVESVCVARHALLSVSLRVRPVPRQPIHKCTAEVDPLVVSSIPDIHLCIEDLESNFGVATEFSKDGKLVLVGTLLQIQNAQCKLEEIFKEQQENERRELERVGAVRTPRGSKQHTREEMLRDVDNMKSRLTIGGNKEDDILHSLPVMHINTGRVTKASDDHLIRDASRDRINDLGSRSPAPEAPFTTQAKAVNDMFASMSDSIRADADAVKQEEHRYRVERGEDEHSVTSLHLSTGSRGRRVSDPESLGAPKASDTHPTHFHKPDPVPASSSQRLAQSLDYRTSGTQSWKHQSNLEKARETVENKTRAWQFSSMDLEDSHGSGASQRARMSRESSQESDNPLYHSGRSLHSHHTNIEEEEDEVPCSQLDVDPNVLEYVRRIHKGTVEEIRRAHNVLIQYMKGDGIAHVRFLPASLEAQNGQRIVGQAKDEFVSLYQTVFFSVIQETVDFDPHQVKNYKAVTKSLKESFAGKVVVLDKVPGEVTIVGKWDSVSIAADWMKEKFGLKKAGLASTRSALGDSERGLRSEYVLDSHTSKPKMRLVMASSSAGDGTQRSSIGAEVLPGVPTESLLTQTTPTGGMASLRGRQEGFSTTFHDYTQSYAYPKADQEVPMRAAKDATRTSFEAQADTSPHSLSTHAELSTPRGQREAPQGQALNLTDTAPSLDPVSAVSQRGDSYATSAREDLSNLREHLSPKPMGGGAAADVRTVSSSPRLEDSRFTYTTDNGLTVTIYTQDITTVTVDTIVCPSNTHLENVGGLARAITVAAGDGYQDLCTDYIHNNGPLGVCEVTSLRAQGYLCCGHILHAVGPMWSLYSNKDQCAHDLRATFTNAFKYANTWLKVASIAVPAISTGVYGVPDDVCARALFEATQAFSYDMSSDTHLRHIHVANLEDDTTTLFSAIFAQLIETGHHMEAPPTAGYDSDVSAGSAAINLNMPLGSKDARKKRRSHTKPSSQDDRDSRDFSPPPPVTRENLASIEKRYERQASDLEERGSVMSYGSMAVYPDGDQPDLPMSSFVMQQLEKSLPRDTGESETQRSDASLATASAQRMGNLDEFLSGLDDSGGHGSLQGQDKREDVDTVQTSLKVASPPPGEVHTSYVTSQRSGSLNKSTPRSYQDTDVQHTTTTRLYPSLPPLDGDATVDTHVLSPRSDRGVTSPVATHRKEEGRRSQPVGRQTSLGGQMEWEVNRKISLEGEEGTGSLIITFVFPQSEILVESLIQTIYLPNNVGGRQLLLLMKKAFDQGLLYRLEGSRVVLCGVEVKKAASGGIMGNGYPDAEYIERARVQLQVLGISEHT